MREESTNQANRRYYESLYKSKNWLLHLIRIRISFDQQSKAKPNSAFLKPYIERLKIDRGGKPISILDYGSGWGSFLAKMSSKDILYCYDLSQNAMDMTCTALRRVGYNLNKASVDQEGWISPDSFDLIVCSHVLEHVDDESSLLQSFRHALKDDGLLFLNVPINEVWDDPKHVRVYSKGSLEGVLVENGFDAIDLFECDKWTGFLLSKELSGDDAGRLPKFIYRSIRLFLALLPMQFLIATERLLFNGRNNQQLLATSRKLPD